ncbi:MAG: aspartyl-tRNA(Asn)/glutamyl-tRNA (Gln) amidotransferase subunit C [Parcubacteria group bacterium LiPW_39]|nr:MAG: aspartyl-tRNA(Asn)/glutamyl-tRNA (Gln) amidotransferase subunit C [Parcubacteria group bacterium LiPW_39]
MFDVNHIAKLARLGLTEEEKDRFAKDMTNILDFVKKLEEVDVVNTEPTAQVTGLENVTRPDQTSHRETEETRRQILANTPETKDNYIKVKAVFE